MIGKLLQRLRSGASSSASDDPPIDHYEIRYRDFDERGWRRLDAIDRTTGLFLTYDEPISREQVHERLAAEELPQGVYKHYPIREDGRMAQPHWTIEYDDE